MEQKKKRCSTIGMEKNMYVHEIYIGLAELERNTRF